MSVAFSSLRRHLVLLWFRCTICCDIIAGPAYTAPCGHHFDAGCLETMFRKATVDESLFPPRCCRMPIPLASVSVYMTSAAVRTFEEKSVEFGTRKRVYCAKPSCSRFLGAQRERSGTYSTHAYQCQECYTRTCSSCKNTVASIHLLHYCDTNEDDRNVIALGQQSGWSRCPGCETIIELNLGCYHMTCR